MLGRTSTPTRRLSEYSLQFANRMIGQLGHSEQSLATGPAPADRAPAPAAIPVTEFQREVLACYASMPRELLACFEQDLDAMKPPATLEEKRFALHCYVVDPRRTGGDRGKTWAGCFEKNAGPIFKEYIKANRRINSVPGFVLARTEDGPQALVPPIRRLETDLDCIALANALCERLGEERFNLWFLGKTRITRDASGFCVGVPNKFLQDWLSRTFGEDLKAVLAGVGGATALRFAIDQELFEAARARPEADDGQSPRKSRRPDRAEQQQREVG